MNLRPLVLFEIAALVAWLACAAFVVIRPGEAALFFVNGRAVGDVRDARFAQLFFGIWLSPQTSEPRLRESLLAGTEP